MKMFSIFFSLMTFAASQAWSWGALGHRTIGLIAQSQLSQTAQTSVQRLLGSESLADVANWADQLKSTGEYKQTVWYHFEKIPDHVSYLENLKNLPEWQKQKGGVIGAILVANEILRDVQTSQEEKKVALKFLVHFVGDLHQPLHTGQPEDNGGVKIKIDWFGVPMSLHAAWDSGMIMSGHRDLFKGSSGLERSSLLYAQELNRKFRDEHFDVDMNLQKWIDESLVLRGAAYEKLYESDPQAYEDLHLPEVDLRIFMASTRLAKMLNEIFGENPVPETERELMQKINEILGDLNQIIRFTP